MSDRTVILTVVKETWARPDSILDLFLESFRIGEGTKPLLNHLLIIAEDTQAFLYCKSRHPHCFYLENSQSETHGKNLLSSASRLRLLQQVIDFGFSVAFTVSLQVCLRVPLPAVSFSLYASFFNCEFLIEECRCHVAEESLKRT